jgi:hypothetical protein
MSTRHPPGPSRCGINFDCGICGRKRSTGAPALSINADCHKHCSRADYRVLAYLLIPRVQDQIRILALEFPAGKTPELLIKLLVEPADRARAKTVPTELFADGFDVPSRYSLDVHLCERRHQRLLAALIALENLGGKPSVAILGNSQLEFAYPGDQAARVVAASKRSSHLRLALLFPLQRARPSPLPETPE